MHMYRHFCIGLMMRMTAMSRLKTASGMMNVVANISPDVCAIGRVRVYACVSSEAVVLTSVIYLIVLNLCDFKIC